MKIATYVDGTGELASPSVGGHVRIYDDASGAWEAIRDMAFEIKPDMTLCDVKSAIRQIVVQMEDCRIFLSTAVRGLIYSVLQEEAGIHIWKSQGPILEQLDIVAGKEAERIARREAPSMGTPPPARCAAGNCGDGGNGRPVAGKPVATSALERIGNGRYRIDLARILASDPNLNSRQILMPVMEEASFETLEILCDHVPRWFSRTLIAMNLRAEFDASSQGLKVLVFPNR